MLKPTAALISVLRPGIYLCWERSHPNANSGLAVGHCQPCFTQLHINTYLAHSEWRLEEASSLSLSLSLSPLSLYAGINEMTSLFAKQEYSISEVLWSEGCVSQEDSTGHTASIYALKWLRMRKKSFNARNKTQYFYICIRKRSNPLN